MARLDALLDQGGACLDPDLTLARLARRLHVPVKQLSVAINRTQGENVSRHVNGYRIRHACKLLVEGHGVTAAMLASGFNTKSNFNREFLRVTGETPSAYRARVSAG
nr:helix-turn-helix domain-containing protein [Stappia sp. WLB 29]